MLKYYLQLSHVYITFYNLNQGSCLLKWHIILIDYIFYPVELRFSPSIKSY